MSSPTVIILTVHGRDADLVEQELLPWLQESHGDSGVVERVSEYVQYASWSPLWFGAVNYLQTEAFIEKVTSIRWHAPEDVLLILEDEDPNTPVYNIVQLPQDPFPMHRWLGRE